MAEAKETGMANEEEKQAGRPRAVRSCELFAGETRVAIEHEGAIYCLRITRQGKLILTK
jgi:hemin uptake protein HemP